MLITSYVNFIKPFRFKICFLFVMIENLHVTGIWTLEVQDLRHFGKCVRTLNETLCRVSGTRQINNHWLPIISGEKDGS